MAEKLIDNDFVMFDLEADSAEEVIRRWQMSWNRMTD